MSPVYLNPQHSSSIPFLDLKGDQQHRLHVFGHHVHDLAASYHNNFLHESHLASSESLNLNHSSLVQEKVEKMVLPHDHKQNDLSQVPSSAYWSHNVGDGGRCSYNYNYPFDQQEGDHKAKIVNNDPKQSKKWKPSKLKIVRKTATTTSKNNGGHKIEHYHDQPGQSNVYRSNGNDNNNGMRVCSDCHTTSTPLWRSGPQGPKSLCNACGIRQRKARRAAMAAAAAAAAAGSANNEVVVASSSPTSSSSIVETPKPIIKEQIIKLERQLDHDYKSHTLPIKKRSKTIHTDRNYNNNNNSLEGDKLFFDNFGLSSSNYLIRASSQRVFPRDEEEGAILLMALSCGLACSS